ncbi:branched-chain amino acid ABC transporter permease [Caldinitratiruptor microaerophilus]|uniref:Branched-chain amino acid ABC transporter permease n=1 Tax=Caldinitratiruptor microaerophilus TaxID=671077 RepID=A0AA35G9S1_9FIRM|nr:branched-chain amino acid ABC transporter permease [Caldinitratiruptor microaerophilus]BDG62376.1 branched-chain amino acid ABC transporter permease [Caldinitratiruptor microaerophilus]
MTAAVLAQSIVSGLLWGAVFALIALGLSLIFGVVDIVNFAHGEFLMVAMYLAWVLNAFWGWDPLLTLPLGAAALFGLGVLTYRLLIRRVLDAPMLAQIIVTFGLMVFLRSLAHLIFRADYRSVQDPLVQGTFTLFGVHVTWPQAVAGLGALIITGLLYWFLYRTETGWALQAVAQNKQAAALMGIDPDRFYSLAWGIGSASVGIAGILLSNFYYIHPEVGAIFGTLAYVTVALGGFGSVPGALVAGILIGLAESLAGVFIDPKLKYAVVFSLYLVVVFVRPRGLMGRV